MRLHEATLFVKDLGRMTAFYRDVLGLQPNEDTRLENWVEFTGAQFSLHSVPGGLADSIRIESPPQPREHTAAKLTFEVTDVAATLATIEAMGLPLLRRPWGGVDVCDPEGNVLALYRAGASTSR
jgi:catechol 2,3-dioxygenase-like lactoylglutathione lyase family enzyme